MTTLKETSDLILKAASRLESLAQDNSAVARAEIRGLYDKYKPKLLNHFNDKLEKLSDDQYSAIVNNRTGVYASAQVKAVGSKYVVSATFKADPEGLSSSPGQHAAAAGVITAYLNAKEALNFSKEATMQVNKAPAGESFSIANDLLFTVP